jgi:hypothetical protein
MTCDTLTHGQKAKLIGSWPTAKLPKKRSKKFFFLGLKFKLVFLQSGIIQFSQIIYQKIAFKLLFNKE